jgi:hypothetical protein
MPQDSVYGPWPMSGEIDICESRGNDAETYPLGNNMVGSTMHWGTSYLNDAYKLGEGQWIAKRTKYSEGFHTFGLEWSEDYLFTWVDGRLSVRTTITPFIRAILRSLTHILITCSHYSKYSSLTSTRTSTCGTTAASPTRQSTAPRPPTRGRTLGATRPSTSPST